MSHMGGRVLRTWIELSGKVALFILAVPGLTISLSAMEFGIVEPPQYKRIAVPSTGPTSPTQTKKEELMRRVNSVLQPAAEGSEKQGRSLIQAGETHRHPTRLEVEALAEASRKALDALNGLKDLSEGHRPGHDVKSNFESRAQMPKNGFTNRSWFKKYEALENTRQKAIASLKLINDGGHYNVIEDNHTFIDGKKIGPPKTIADQLNAANLKDCHNIFLDLGANFGVHVREVFEPELFPVSPMLPVFDQYFGAADVRNKATHSTGVCAFGFEANPYFTSYLQKIQDRYALRGWQVHIFAPAVVSDHDGQVDFYVDNRPGNSFWGSSTFPCCNHEFTQQQLPAFNIAAFVQELVKKRSANTKGKIVVKMDLEGSEFVVLPAMLMSGILCQATGVDALYVEWHPWAVANQTGSFLTPDELKLQIEQQIACEPTRIVDMDDETYKDGALITSDVSSGDKAGSLSDWNQI